MESYLVRVWSADEAVAPPSAGVRGVVQHLASGRSSHFTSLDDLGRLLQAGTDAAPEPDRAVGTSRPDT